MANDMANDDEWVVLYSGQIQNADLLKSLLEGSGIERLPQNEAMGQIAPHLALAGATPVKILIPRGDLR